MPVNSPAKGDVRLHSSKYLVVSLEVVSLQNCEIAIFGTTRKAGHTDYSNIPLYQRREQEATEEDIRGKLQRVLGYLKHTQDRTTPSLTAG
jgi:hypothetical protein